MTGKNHNHYKVKELRKVMYSHGLLSGKSSSAYDLFIHKTLDKIDKGIDFDALVEFIRYELVVTYGYFTYEVNPEQIAESIDEWWLNYSESH